MIQPRAYQTEAVESIYRYFETKQGNPVLALPTGCHAKGHGIMMSNGTIKAVEDIQIGDAIMGPDSLPRYVLRLARGRQEMRRIIPTRGESFVVNLDHKLNVTKVREGYKFPCYEERNETISIRQYEEGTDWYRHLRKLRRVGIQLPKQEQPLPPYFIGLMLGDGSLCNNSFNLTTADSELADYFKQTLKEYGLTVREDLKSDNKAKSYHGVDPLSNRSNPNRVTSIFRNLGMQEKRSWEKSIPDIYKRGSFNQRSELLAGLIDSDGYIGKTNDVQYVTCSPQLAKDVTFIIRSLGLGATCTQFQSTLNGVNKRIAWSISVSGDFSFIPFKRYKHIGLTCNPNRNPLVTGFKIEKLPEDDYYGFELSGDHLYLDEFFNVHHNTGKSLIIAMFLHSVITRYRGQRIMVLTHVKELIGQDYQALLRYWPSAPAGIYSAGLNRKEAMMQITFAGIASVVKKPELFGHIDLIIIDEAHLVSQNDQTSYQKFIGALKSRNSNLKVIGLTATPWRLGQGHITDDGLFTDICFDITNPGAFNRLIAEGFLVPLIPRQPTQLLDVDGVHIRGGDFVASELQIAVDRDEITIAAMKETIQLAQGRMHCLVFSSGIDHAEHINATLNEMGETSVVIHSRMPDKQRDAAIIGFKNGKYRFCVNNNCLTTGFDFPAIDCIVVLRPTTSTVLWVQMMGRGTRPSEGKSNCLVLDFSRNTKRLGPINDPMIPRKPGKGGPGEAPYKVCSTCDLYNHTSVRNCIYCGSEFRFEVKFGKTASTSELIRGETPITEVMKIDHITYSQHNKQGKPPAMKVTYYCGLRSFSEYVCFEHEGYAGRKAKLWWRERAVPITRPVPQTTMEGIEEAANLEVATHIRVWINREPYPEILGHCFDGTAFGTAQPEDESAAPTIQVRNKKVTENSTHQEVTTTYHDDDIPF